MKLNRIITICTVAAALVLGAGSVLAQNDNGGNGGGNGDNGNRRQGFSGGGGGNFDPAQFQQRMMENVRDSLGFTNDTEWSAVQPLVQKVMDERRDTAGAGMGRLFRRNGNGNGGNNRMRNFGPPNPEAEALQKALDDNAPSAQVKDLLAKYQASQKDKRAKLEQDQTSLRKVLTVKQEAQATLLGLLN